MKQKVLITGCLLAVLLLSVSGYSDEGSRDYRVSITNITHGQTFTPILIATHKKGVKLFSPGSPASQELEMLAEGGDTGPLTASLSMNNAVGHIMTTGGLLGPGETVTVDIPAGRNHYVSIASMLIPTNDGFFSLNGVMAPGGHQPAMYLSPAYDAGTEENDELCVHIPGPFGCDGKGEGYNLDDGEGYVHIHAGIHGIGDVPGDVFDWRNPVARIIIQRTDDHNDKR